MNFNSQSAAIEELHKLSDANRQSVVIEGPPGSGKTHLTHLYADMLGIEDYSIVHPKVSEVKEALDSTLALNNNIMLVIENLDLGVKGAAYALLKTLEEPLPNLYIVITCRNLAGIPDTIISRSAVVNVSPPTLNDIDAYGDAKDHLKFSNLSRRLVWKCVRSFTDADEVLQMTNGQIDYYEALAEVCQFKESVSNIVWKLGHYPDNSECNVELAIRSVVELMQKPFITKCGIECIRDLSKSRIAPHAILSKFVFNAKYCE